MHITFPPAGQSRREENKQPKGEYTMETLRIGLVGTGGIGRYPAKGFVHVDVRKAKSRWTG